MRNKKRYPPEVYRRLQLVEKQFQTQAADEKKRRSAARQPRFSAALINWRLWLPWFIYVVMTLLVIGVILTVVLD